MTENWIFNEQHDRLTLGDNDVSITIPEHQLRDYARMVVESRPISLPAGFFMPTGWTTTDCPNRVTVRLSRYNYQAKSPRIIQNGGEVKLRHADMMNWKTRKTS